MKRLIRDKGVFNCTFKTPYKCKIVNSKNEEITEWHHNKIAYLKSNNIVIAAIDISGKLILYKGWDENRTNLCRICKFTGTSTKEIKNMIKIKHSDVVIENKLKIIK